MQQWIIAFGLGLLLMTGIQDSPSFGVLCASTIGLSLLMRKWRWAVWVCGLCAGLLWGIMHFTVWQDGRLPEALQGEVVVLSGTIIDVKSVDDRRQKITFWVDCLAPYGVFKSFPKQSFLPEHCHQQFRVAQISWYAPFPEMAPGQHWRIAAKLKWGHGFSNPGGFDYERWLMQHQIQAVGYVRKEIDAQQLDQPFSFGRSGNAFEPISVSVLNQRWRAQSALMRARLNGLRYQVKRQIDQLMGQSEFRGIIVALVVGDRHGLSGSQRQILRDTGTAHLMAISGLHIGLLAGLAYWITKGIVSFFPALILWLPLQRWALLGACGAATAYAALAGFSTPTLRAMFMLYVFSFYSFRDLPLPVSKSLLVAALLVLWVDPFDIFSSGFWLSFVAVGVIIWCAQGRVKNDFNGRLSSRFFRALRGWGGLQWGIFIGLLPSSLFFIGQISILAPLINFIVIPVFGWIIVPLSLLATAFMGLSPGFSKVIFLVLDWVLQILWPLFQWTANQSDWVYQQSLLSPLALVVLMLTALLVLAAKGLPLKSFGALLGLSVMALVLPGFGFSGDSPLRRDSIPMGGVDFTLLDVGQGLSAVIRTRHHSLVYDLGPQYGTALDAGSAVVVPFLRSAGVDSVDALILSHDDMDHTGGFDSFEAHFEAAEIYAPANVLARFSEHSSVMLGLPKNCANPEAWQWDDVNFMVYAVGRTKKNHRDADVNIDSETELQESRRRDRGYSVKWNDNNQSCVLKIWGDGFSVLIPGDIEKKAEIALVQDFPVQFSSLVEEVSLKADILVVPHHGSRTSSSTSFLDVVQPKHGLVSAGYLNRFGHPYPPVVSRFQQRGVELFRTDEGGALQYQLRPGLPLAPPSQHRVLAKRLWLHP